MKDAKGINSQKGLTMERWRYDVLEEQHDWLGIPIKHAEFWSEEEARSYIEEHQDEHANRLYIGYRKFYD